MDAAHWDEAYARLGARGVSWFHAEERTSLDLIASMPTPPESVIDVGGGASGLAAALAGSGVARVSVLDISAEALRLARDSAGRAAGAIEWITADIRAWTPAAAELVRALGDDLMLVASRDEVHMTPSGTEQPFTWVLARRLPSVS